MYSRPTLNPCLVTVAAILVAVTPYLRTVLPSTAAFAFPQTADMQASHTPSPPTEPGAAPKTGERDERLNPVREAVDETRRLLEHLHRRHEEKARELEEQGVVVVYGEDGQAISISEARERSRRLTLERETKREGRKQTARLGFSILLLLVAGYFLLRWPARWRVG